MRKMIVKGVAWAALCSGIMLTSCDTMSNSTKGYVAGSVGGTVLGAGLGAIIGGDYGADVGANLGMIVGGVAGAAAGADMDAKEAARGSQYAPQTSSSQSYSSGNSYYDKDTGLIYTKISDGNSILFDSRSSNLNRNAYKEIHSIISKLRQTQYAGIVIYGSTDDTESRDYAYELSNDRANAVADALVESGVNGGQISVVGLGNDYPVADNGTYDGRAKNRCVEVYIINIGQKQH